jgi:hypothetical protein
MNVEATLAGNSTGLEAVTQAYSSTLVYDCSPGFVAGTVTYTCGQNRIFETGDSCAGHFECYVNLYGADYHYYYYYY